MSTAKALHGTTILAVRHRGGCAIAGDGQVTMGRTVMKHGAKKIRRMHNGQVLAGFAGSTADALMTRTFAVREVVLGVGGLLAATNATSRPTDLRLWAALGALTDGGDFCLALAGSRDDSSSTRLAALVAAAGLVCEAWALHAAGPNRRRA